MNILLSVQTANITACNGREIDVHLEGVNLADILEQFTLNDILSHYEKSEILDLVGIKACMEHYDLVIPQD